MGLYAAKAGIVGRLSPVVDGLAARGVSPDAITLAAVPVAVLGGACIVASTAVPALLVAVPFLAALRLVLNLLDGALARKTGRSHPRGELYNEVGDRIADVAFLAPVAVLPGASPIVVLGGLIVAILASHVGITAKAAGSERIYAGLIAKPERMVLLGIFAPASLIAGPNAWTVFGPVLLIGSSLTLVQRLIVAVRRLS
jgi:CDP-diacylglycerol--glycerol-3-phosphate 3-phosphatidyltransferase